MWTLMKPCFVLIAIWYASRVIAADKRMKNNNFTVWNLRGNESSIPADNFNLILNNTSGSETPILQLYAENFKGNITTILFALPRDKNDSHCPSEIDQNMDLRRYRKPSPHFKISYDAIMTGCFYVVMRNEDGTYWQLGPYFIETNYSYVDKKLQLVRNETKPQQGESSRELHSEIKVPLRCLQVIATLYEFEGKVANATAYAKDQILPEGGKEQQSCTIFYDGSKKTVERNCDEMNTNFAIDAYLSDEGNESWTAKIICKNLRRGAGGNTYYMTFFPVVLNQCLREYRYMHSWAPIDRIIFYGGYFDESSDPIVKPKVDISLIVGISYSLVGVIVIAMLVYWKWRCSRFMINEETGDNEESARLQTFGSSVDGKESNQILLLYVKGPPLLTNAIRNLKDYLKRTFTCHIRDVYELNEWHDIAVLGATEWVEQQLKAGSKVVWIDTPEFRSLLNDKGKKYNGDDFRDEALPHAVDLIKPLFQDAQTQYSRHFVVRLKGFEVDDRQADPLQTVTPYVRYNIPDHLADLCEHLNIPPKL